MQDDVLFESRNGWGIMTLDRPSALNALTIDMCRSMTDRLLAWASDDTVKAVLIRGNGEKAFCAGADIRWLHDISKQDPATAASFFRTEYNLNSLIHHYPKPYVALMHGVIMGGGVGLSGSAPTRIVSPGVTWAMPETGIGMLPDVGASYYLSRMDGGLGPYLGLTGHRMDGPACLYAGIATHLVPYEDYPVLQQELFGIGADSLDQKAIDKVAGAFHKAEETLLAESRAQIDQQFAGKDSIEAIMASLQDEGGAFAEKALTSLRRMSPVSLKVTLRALNHAADLSFDECLRMEFNIVRQIMEGPDFHEGVRAQIIEKDRNPAWLPATVEAVSADVVARYFRTPEEGALQLRHHS